LLLQPESNDSDDDADVVRLGVQVGRL
jgi:hypothetical protein